MNLSRAYSLAYGEELSVGRVQTPTLAMLVERELAIRQLRAGRLSGSGGHVPARGTGGRAIPGHVVPTARRREPKETCSRRCVLPRMAKKPSGSWRARGPAQAAIESVEAQTQRMPPPLLYDLTELQRHANRLFGFSAQKTLELAQALYERHKLISYPRTDSRHLSQDVAGTLPDG